MEKVYLIGIEGEIEKCRPDVLKLIEQADILAGGQRLLDVFPNFKGNKLVLKTPLNNWLENLKQQSLNHKIVILASGDPNFFGLAKKMLTIFKAEEVVIIPSVTTIQKAFAEIAVTWANVETVSLHGRTAWREFWASLFRALHYKKGWLAVYTDPVNTPAVICSNLLARGQNFWQARVFEDLGSPKQKISCLTLSEASQKTFSPLNLLLLEAINKPAKLYLGQPENNYEHEAGLISKSEIRTAIVGQMEFEPDNVLWDVGTASGSVSIESSLLLPYGEIWSLEKSLERVEQAKKNRSKFGVCNMEILAGEAMQLMDSLPNPDRVFFGGGGSNIASLIEKAAEKINMGAIMLVSVVSLDNLNLALQAFKKQKADVSITSLQVARSANLAGSLYFKPLNPIWLVKAKFC